MLSDTLQLRREDERTSGEMQEWRPGTTDSQDVDELDQLCPCSPGPWRDSLTGSHVSPALWKSDNLRSSLPPQATGSRRIPSRTEPTASGFLPIVPCRPHGHHVKPYKGTNSKRRAYPHPPFQDISVAQAYSSLVKENRAMELERQEDSQRYDRQVDALRTGIEQLSDEHVQQQKHMIRVNTLKNEVDIFQQHLDPFIFKMRTPHEHQVRSSVYRHFVHMQDVHDLGIPMYSLGDYEHTDDEKVLLPRTCQNFYRRIRRRNAADFVDRDLITRPKPRSKQQTIEYELPLRSGK